MVENVERAEAPRGSETCHLLGRHTHSLDAELAVAHVEKVFQVGAKEVDHQDVVEPLRAIVLNLRDSNCEERRNKPSGSKTNGQRGEQGGTIGGIDGITRIYLRVPFRVLYDLYSSRS